MVVNSFNAFQGESNPLMLTAYHACFYAHELTKRSSSDDIAKLGPSLFNAAVDLNPHQLDAALFAFRSPLSRGAILADEVGLGKTIEAGLIVSQLWAERRRRILIITPTFLRKQWAQELLEKFHLPVLVMDTREYNTRARSGEPRPLQVQDHLVICSYHFARSKASEIAAIPWDLVVIDEAHRLRNVYKPGNKIAASIKKAVFSRPLVLLTATPLQNSLLELYGLVSFLDEHLFGDVEAFRARYMRGPIEQRQLSELRHRLRPICQRTLRRQVVEYVRFTNRIPMTQDFTPTAEEQALYDQISSYLQRETLNALPASQRKLMTLVLRKLLASSTFAIASTLTSLADRLSKKRNDLAPVLEDFEVLDEVEEEWADASEGQVQELTSVEAGSPQDIQAELDELIEYGNLAKSITVNAKGQALLNALDLGFRKLTELGANRKAVIFTESRRTQAYILELLNQNGYEDRVLTINGTNTDDRAGLIYKAWVERHKGEPTVTGNKSVDLRAALVEHFREYADIMIATEAAAEGVNLQFCSLVVNYDLPWNPQRIEQRIGRCHRYGQTHDVVVINFLNRSNEADQRVFELLSEKFRLFEGVFGSSDEVLGALESGVDFERRIADIYQTCRTSKEIDTAFSELQSELEEQISSRMADTRTALLENFDEEVHRRLKLSQEQSLVFLDRLQKALWNLTKFELSPNAEFDDERCQFSLFSLGPGWPQSPLGRYQLVTPGHKQNGCLPYRFGDELAEHAVHRALTRELRPAHIAFNYSGHDRKIGLLDSLKGKAGWLAVSKLTVSALESEDRLLIAMLDDEGRPLHPDIGERLFDVSGEVVSISGLSEEVDAALISRMEQLREEALGDISIRNSRFFDEEIDKLERWADDLKHGLEMELKELDSAIKQARRDARSAADLQSKVEVHRQIKDLESERSKKRRLLYDAQDEIDERKDDLISRVEARLKQSIELHSICRFRWQVA